ncbi:MAG: hypothetical protein U5K73_04650 [Halofilum sp. (in: g-proteobacteria)]|nr:hypothetical protein [Halofilum sp. (in: g-proteobacteria)]
MNYRVLQAACHFAVFRMDMPPQWYEPRRLELARRESTAAQKAYAVSKVTLDGLGDELAAIANALQEVER